MIEINWILYHQPKQKLKAGDISERLYENVSQLEEQLIKFTYRIRIIL